MPGSHLNTITHVWPSPSTYPLALADPLPVSSPVYLPWLSPEPQSQSFPMLTALVPSDFTSCIPAHLFFPLYVTFIENMPHHSEDPDSGVASPRRMMFVRFATSVAHSTSLFPPAPHSWFVSRIPYGRALSLVACPAHAPSYGVLMTSHSPDHPLPVLNAAWLPVVVIVVSFVTANESATAQTYVSSVTFVCNRPSQ